MNYITDKWVHPLKEHKPLPDTMFLDRKYFASRGFWHTGEDWNGPGGGDSDYGLPIYAPAIGIIDQIGSWPTWGRILVIRHRLPKGWYVWTQLAHMSQFAPGMDVGRIVRMGEAIGKVGKGEGDKLDSHLHWEIRREWLPADAWDLITHDRYLVNNYYLPPTRFIKALWKT